NPLTGQWQDASGTLVMPPLLDRQRGLPNALGRVEGAEKKGHESTDGVDTYRLSGRIPAAVLASLVGSAQAAAAPVAVELWIGSSDDRLRRARLVGAILPDESAQLERTLALSAFDAAPAIEAPLP